MADFLRISRRQLRGFGIYFTFIPFVGPRASRLLKTFLLVLSSSIGLRCENQKGLDILGRSLVRNLKLEKMASLYITL